MTPTPLTPPMGGGGPKIYFRGVLLMEHSDLQRVKYFWEALDFLGESPNPPDPLPPWPFIGGRPMGGPGGHE